MRNHDTWDAEDEAWWDSLSRRERWSMRHMPRVWKWGKRLGLLRERSDGNTYWLWRRKATFFTLENTLRELGLPSPSVPHQGDADV